MYSTYEAWLMDLGWTVEDIGALSDEVKTFAQAVFDAEYGADPADPAADPALPPVVAPAAASATPPPVAVPIAVPVAASAVDHVQAQMRQATVAELARVEACRKKCPNTALAATVKLNQAGRPDDAGTPKKVNVLQQAIGHGWTPVETELVVTRASRATAGQQGIPQGDGDASKFDKIRQDAIASRAPKATKSLTERMGLLPAAGYR